jgi:hypothetical protein
MRKRRPEPWNDAAKREMHRYGMPEYWLLISEVEAQALLDHVVSTKILEQCAVLLRAPLTEKEPDTWRPI